MIKIEVENLDSIAENFVTRILKSAKRSKNNNKLWENKELLDKVESVYLAPKNKLLETVQSFEEWLKKKHLSKNKKSNEIRRLFFNYDLIKSTNNLQTNGNWLAEQLRVNVCPYCNRQYTFTVNKKNGNKSVRPQFDHFYPKSEYPYLALSFYNLIPSCPTCNHTKKEDIIDINPYEKGFDEDCRFTIDKIENCVLNGSKENWKIKLLPEKEDHSSHINAFALDELYNQHKDYAEEIVFKAQSYTDGYYESLKDSFSNLGLTENEMRLMIFGNYIEPSEYCKRPLSKLTADILYQLEILK